VESPRHLFGHSVVVVSSGDQTQVQAMKNARLQAIMLDLIAKVNFHGLLQVITINS